MKKYLFYSIATVLFLAGCTNVVEDNLSTTKEPIVLSVTVDDTRTHFGDTDTSEYPVLWKTGDQVSVNGVLSEPLSEAYNNLSQAYFTVTEPVQAPYTVVYPASAIKGNSILFNRVQTYEASQFDSSAAILYGTSSSLSVSLKHACAYVKVLVRKSGDEKITGIKLFSQSGEPLSGVFTINPETSQLTCQGQGRNYVYLTSENGIEYDADGMITAVFAIPSGVYKSGFAVSVIADGKEQMSKTAYTAKGVTLAAGTMKAMPELSFVKDATPFSGGEGTSDNPYRIATVNDLVSLSEAAISTPALIAENVHYRMVADIDMSYVEKFTPIACVREEATPGEVVYTSGEPFRGIFDGEGHYIDNLALSGNGEPGFFSNVSGAVISNINFYNANVSTGDAYLAIVACKATDDSKIKNIKILESQFTSKNRAAAIVANAGGCTITDCYIDSATNISGTGAVAGMAGYITGPITVRNCVVKCDINGDGDSVGGILGWTSCTVSSTMIVDGCRCYGNVTGKYGIGGIWGRPNTTKPAVSKIYIVNCGYLGSEIKATAPGSNRGSVGGIVGWAQIASSEVYIMNCYSRAITLNVSKSCTQPSLGGILGYGSIDTGANGPLVIAGTYNTTSAENYILAGSKNTTNYYGGIVGQLTSGAAPVTDLKDSYYMSGVGQIANTSPRSAENVSTFTDDKAGLSTLLSKLNEFVLTQKELGGVALLGWKEGSDGYPTLDWPEDETREQTDLTGTTEDTGNAGSDGGNLEDINQNNPIDL
ncbi:MAG: hypothetical protein KBS95_05550 [Alistipes sp.]|nr:hypothetical protein [Candidatus Alistipes equi]